MRNVICKIKNIQEYNTKIKRTSIICHFLFVFGKLNQNNSLQFYHIMNLKELIKNSTNLNFSSQIKHIGNLNNTTITGLIGAAYENKGSGPLFVICADSFDALSVKSNLKAILPLQKIYYFSDFETLPYDTISPHQDIVSTRLEILSTLSSLKDGIVITTVSALMHRICPLNYIKQNSFVIKKGDRRDIEQMKDEFVQQGYYHVEKVLSHGEFTIRGSILDIYPMGSLNPYRIDFFDDEVDSIRTFDPDSQRSNETIDSICLLPAHEFPLDKEAISVFRSNYRDYFTGANLVNHPIYQAISKGAIPSGIEYYIPLFFEKTQTIFDYIDTNTDIILVGDVFDALNDFDVEVHKRALMFKGNPDHPSLEPSLVFMNAKECTDRIKEHRLLNFVKREFNESECSKRGYSNLNAKKIPNIAFVPSDKNSSKDLVSYINSNIEQGYRFLISAVSEGRRQTLKEIFPESITNIHPLEKASSFDEFVNSKSPLMLTLAPFDEGFNLPDSKICYLTESEILGFKAVKQKRSSKNARLSQDTIIKNLASLSEGQIVVHIDHGIGRYRGLKTMVIGGIKGEFLTIEYAGGDMLNIPITALNKVARYSGSENPSLSKLGNDTWAKRKNKAQGKVIDVAAALLDLYAKREAHKGTSFEISTKALEEFASGFSYQETQDQALAIENTLNDLKKPTPMDRLVCGDVGFGKTEVALRAAFVVASNSKQVALLVPTTILAEQHYQNFKERFASTAITIELLSRFKSTKEQNEVIKKVETGAVDIIIGTHKLLSKDIKFKDLGLIIVDEEHRFGVKQKESLKKIRASVDILTLTATPIPRTLNMAMEGMRELSIIATPPESRLAVKTFVTQRTDSITREAILRELKRGGQVYYLHNDVATIEQRARQLSELVPEAKIGIGHGQLNEKELQKVMHDFYHQRYNLLVCSTIVENGLDVPSANTIIIDRADLLGLAQLHQLRGRVGRSHHQAYAYLFTPPEQVLSKDAKLRLEAISSLEELGAGFVLATHDLEIRGAGELLGEEQSGQIESIGFALYSQMLENAVKALKEGKEPSLVDLNMNECDIDLHIPCLFPDDYIGDVNTRLSLYKRLSSLESDDGFTDLKVELIDRFGFLPKAAENLFEITKLKKLATMLGIKRISGDEMGGIIEFNKDHKVSNDYLISLVTSCKNNEYRITGQNSLRYNLKESEKYPRLALVKQLLMAFDCHR